MKEPQHSRSEHADKKAESPRREEETLLPKAAPRSGGLARDRECSNGHALTTDQGVVVPHTDDSLKAGPRGPTLIEDFHLREKITHFDHERIPERVVHARGSGAHGYFQVYRSLEKITHAGFLCDPTAKTPVFVRFSTVVGSRGSADTVRDARGFATKFYTSEGNFDLVGNNIPVFFIQDGIKFPDLVHAIKPEPHHEMPQAASAHDTFWDFVSLTPETIHMVMWVMSDRGIPRSYRMMEGFGVHTFRLVNAAGRSVFCKFHWKPMLGAHSLVWDEAQKIAGKDPDFHRRDLWEAIENGDYPEYELGLQIVPEEESGDLGIDLLDATKLIPEEQVPVQRVGKLVLNKNPDNFFAETEQVAFCIGNLVPGIDVTNDPLLQARLFSYLDTQLLRLGGPNFNGIPINRPLAAVHNHHQDGFQRHAIPTSRALYHPNSIAGGMPAPSRPGFDHFPDTVRGPKTRERAESFGDHFSQATLFLHSQSPAERRHLVQACQFELAKVERLGIRQRVVTLFQQVDPEFAREVAAGIGVNFPMSIDGSRRTRPKPSPALSLENQPSSCKTRKVAALAIDGVAAQELKAVCGALHAAGAMVEVVSVAMGQIRADDGRPVDVDKTFLTASPVFYDAVYVPGSALPESGLEGMPAAVDFVREAWRHAKAVAAGGSGTALLKAAGILNDDGDGNAPEGDPGLVIGTADDVRGFADAFIQAIAAHRSFERELAEDQATGVTSRGRRRS